MMNKNHDLWICLWVDSIYLDNQDNHDTVRPEVEGESGGPTTYSITFASPLKEEVSCSQKESFLVWI
jgi:hypothetical protein